MQFQNNFDLEEFLAYLLPGFLFLGVLIFEKSSWFSALYQTLPVSNSEFFVLFVLIVMFVTISLILGHIFSVVSRFVWRELINRMLGDPEQAIFTNRPAFFTKALNDLIADRFAIVFGTVITDTGIRKAVPRLIRSRVFLGNNHAAASREKIVRSRSICANLVTPILAIALLGPLGMPWSVQAGLGCVAVLLLLKQRDLDIREAKEIYLSFVAMTDPARASTILQSQA